MIVLFPKWRHCGTWLFPAVLWITFSSSC